MSPARGPSFGTKKTSKGIGDLKFLTKLLHELCRRFWVVELWYMLIPMDSITLYWSNNAMVAWFTVLIHFFFPSKLWQQDPFIYLVISFLISVIIISWQVTIKFIAAIMLQSLTLWKTANKYDWCGHNCSHNVVSETSKTMMLRSQSRLPTTI